ncbi:MFS transporter [Granulicella sp. S156]|uniref:MFS transporter n=1 Tax=Granulicella sp. S156 TaxID=1747224 RepID=UPI00131ED038|nr:MFS transporter [Granulicella sp. S156]
MTVLKPKPHKCELQITGLRWWIAGLLFLATLISYIDRLTLSILAPTICRELHLSNFQYASISVWFLFTYSIGQTIFGKLQDRIGTKTGLSIAMAIWSVAEVAQAMARGLFGLSGLRLVLGLGEGGHWPAAIKGVSEWFPAKERALGMGIVNTGATLGSALAPPLIIWLQLSFGWRTTFIATGLLGFIWLALWQVCYQPPTQHPWLYPAELDLIQKEVVKPETAMVSPAWRDLLRNRHVQGIVLSRFLGDPVWWLYLVWLPLYLYSARGLSLKAIGLSAWIPYVFADAGALLGGGFSGWLIHRGWKPMRARRFAILLATVLALAGMLVGGARSATQAIILISIVLFAFQFWVNNVQTLTSDLFPNHLVASISGLAGTGAGLGAMIFMLSTGWLVDHFGYTLVLVISGLLIPCATAVLWMLSRNTEGGNKTEPGALAITGRLQP